MQVSNFLNVAVKDDVTTLEISGEIGYNFWADTFEDYKKNTSEGIKAELNAISQIKSKKINVVLESLGGDLAHALAIRSLLVNSGAEIEIYLRGANASSSTIIATSSKDASKVHMDSTGLYLIHKPMSQAFGNSNDMEQMKKDLDKWQSALENAYIEMGVSNEVLNDLMERNGGHGDWLTYDEAKEFGFVGNKWETKKTQNLTKDLFVKNNLLIPKNLKMENSEEKTLLEKIWNKISTKEEAPKNEVSEEEKTSVVAEVMQILEPRLVALEEAIAKLAPANMEEEEEEEPTNMEEDEEKNKLEEELKNLKVENQKLIGEIANKKETPQNKEYSENLPSWKKVAIAHNKINN